MPAKKVFTIEKDGEQIAVFVSEEDRDFCIEALREKHEDERVDEDQPDHEFIAGEEYP